MIGEDSHDNYSFTDGHGNIFLTAVPGPVACIFQIVHYNKSLFVFPFTKKCWHISIICNLFSKYSTFLQCLDSLCRQANIYVACLFICFSLTPILKWPLLLSLFLWSYDSFLTHFIVLSFCRNIFSDSCSCYSLCFLILNILCADIISGAICASQALQWGHT